MRFDNCPIVDGIGPVKSLFMSCLLIEKKGLRSYWIYIVDKTHKKDRVVICPIVEGIGPVKRLL
jgi:hypothetical protein